MRRMDLSKPIAYRDMPKWATAESEQIIWNLHRIEKELRKEIEDEQVKHLTRAEILALYPGGRK